MPNELEQRLTRLLAAHPEPSPVAERVAREAALATIAPAPRRPRRAVSMILVAAGIAVIMTGVALAASPGSFRGLRDVVAPAPAPPVKSHLPVTLVPHGAAGFTVQVGNRLWVAKPHRIALRGVPLAAAATSPQALYAVGESAGRLEAVSLTDRHVAWSVPLGGTLAAAAWSPYPIRIAYIVRRGGHALLHVIWGNGVNDEVIGPASARMPTWRSDSLAVAYVGPRGTALLDTVGSRAPERINQASACGAQRITGLAFAPSSPMLAESTDGPALILADTRRPGHVTCIPTEGYPASHLQWLSPANLIYSGAGVLTRVSLNHGQLALRGSSRVDGRILGVAAAPGGGSIAIAVRHGSRIRILVADPPALRSFGPLRPHQRLGVAPPAGRSVRIGWS